MGRTNQQHEQSVVYGQSPCWTHSSDEAQGAQLQSTDILHKERESSKRRDLQGGQGSSRASGERGEAALHLQHSGVGEGLGLQQEGKVLHHLCQLAVDSLHVSAGTVASTMTTLLPWQSCPLCTRHSSSRISLVKNRSAQCTLTFGTSTVDGVELGVDVILQVKPGHCNELLQALLQLYVLGHVGGRVDVQDGQRCVSGAQHALSGRLPPYAGIPLPDLL